MPDITPNEQQRKAIEHPPGPLMILAGAGTGKTFTLLHRIRHLISSDQIQPEHVLLLTFTEKATTEARETIHDILGEKAESIFVGTFHSFCHSIMRRYGPAERVDDVLWQESDILYYLINHFDEMDFIRSRVFSDNPIKAIRESFIPFFNRVSDELLSPAELESKLKDMDNSQEWFAHNFPGIHDKNTRFDDVAFQLHDLVQAYSFFQKTKADNNALDFGDMILDCFEVLKNNQSVLKQLPHKDINSELEAHFRIIQSCSVKTNDGERILLAARPESRYPYFYPRDAACASGLLAYLSTSGLSIADDAYGLLKTIAGFVLEVVRDDGYIGQRYALSGEEKSIYKQEDNNAHGLITLSNYLLTAEKRKEDIRDIDKVLLSINNASQFAIKNYYRPEINLFHSTTSIHESALEEGFS